MNDDNQNNLVAPAIQNADVLTEKGYLSPDTVSRFSQPEQSQLEQQVPLQQQSDAEILQQAEALNQEVEEDDTIVNAAEEVVQQDAIKQQKSQQIIDAVDMKDQKEANKEVLKSQLAQEDALQEVALEEQQDTEARMATIESELAKEQQELKNMSIDDIFKDDKAPISKAQSIIAILLGGIGQGLMGGGANLGLQAVNKTMDDYFEKQKTGLKEKLSKKQRVFDLLKLQLDKHQNATDNELKKAQIRKINQQMSIASQQMQMQRASLMEKQMMQQKIASGKFTPEQERLYVESLDKEDRKRYVPGFGLAKDFKAAENANKQLEFGEQAIEQVNKIKGLMQEFGSVEVLNRGAVGAEESTRKNLQIQLKELFNLGVLNGPDLELLEDFTGGDFFSPTTLESTKRAKLQATEDYIKNKVDASLRRAGLPVQGSSKADKALEALKKRGLSDQKALEVYTRMKAQGKL